MGNSAQKQASHCDVDHGLGHIEAGFIVTHEPAPARHPAEGSFHYPAPRQQFEAWLGVGPAHDLQHEVAKRRLVEQPGAVIGAIGEQMLEPRPTLADGVEDRLRTGAVGDVRCGQVHHQQPSVGVDGDMTLAPDDLFVGVVASCLGVRCFDGLAVKHAAGRAKLAQGSVGEADGKSAEGGFPPNALAVEHKRHVMNSLEQHAAHEAAEPPIDRLPRTEVRRQHPPSTTAARHVADRVQHLAQIDADLAPALRWLGHQRLDPLPFRVGQVSRIPLGLAGNIGHPATALSGPHPKLESPITEPPQPFSNGVLDHSIKINQLDITKKRGEMRTFVNTLMKKVTKFVQR